MKASGGNDCFCPGVFRQPHVAEALGLSFFKFSALMLHLLCVSPHAEAECRTVAQRLAVAVSTGKD